MLGNGWSPHQKMILSPSLVQGSSGMKITHNFKESKQRKQQNETLFTGRDAIQGAPYDQSDWSQARINRATDETNNERFKGHSGVLPKVCCEVWKDLQTTSIEEARISPSVIRLKYFFMGLHTLRKYPTEIEREAIFDISIRHDVTRVGLTFGKFKLWRLSRLFGSIVMKFG